MNVVNTLLNLDNKFKSMNQCFKSMDEWVNVGYFVIYSNYYTGFLSAHAGFHQEASSHHCT